MKSPRCRWRCRPSCCACCRSARWSALGARAMMSLDVRVLATTNRDLRAEVKAGEFREDLYYRLCVFPMTSHRRCASGATTCCHWPCGCWKCAAARVARIPALSADAAQLLLAYSWPGNIRELDNLLQRAMILANGPVIDAAHIRFEACARVPRRCTRPAPAV